MGRACCETVGEPSLDHISVVGPVAWFWPQPSLVSSIFIPRVSGGITGSN